jgi:hypothetical protein
MLMYTSCGWFFSEITGIETVQDMQYAACAIELADDILPSDTEEKFASVLQQAKSNIPDYRDGKWVYENFVKNIYSIARNWSINSCSTCCSQDDVLPDTPEKYYQYTLTVMAEGFREGDGSSGFST